MIDASPVHLAMIKRILAELAPECDVRVFGSRINGRARPFSDLDLAIIAPHPLDWRRLEQLKDAFSESDLPFMVDVLDWNTVSPRFREVIAGAYEILQTRAA